MHESGQPDPSGPAEASGPTDRPHSLLKRDALEGGSAPGEGRNMLALFYFEVISFPAPNVCCGEIFQENPGQ